MSDWLIFCLGLAVGGLILCFWQLYRDRFPKSERVLRRVKNQLPDEPGHDADGNGGD